MNIDQFDDGPAIQSWLEEPVWLPDSDTARIAQLVHQTPQQRGWLPPFRAWRFQPIVNAAKFVVAGVVVALFGVFLFWGVLTTQRSDESTLLPGVDLVTEHVRPGVYRILSDGEHDLSENVRSVAGSSLRALGALDRAG